MTDEQLKEKIKLIVAEETSKQFLEDLTSLMNRPEGRRFYQRLITICGQDVTSFTKDSRTYFNEGMRNVALMLEYAMRGTGLNGVDLMHKAEKEYIIYQERMVHDIKIKLKR
jgi:hypothetical protein